MKSRRLCRIDDRFTVSLRFEGNRMRLTTSFSVLAVVLAAAATAVSNSAAETPQLRSAWQQAREQLRAGAAQLPVERALRRYVLYPYLESAALLATISSSRGNAASILAAHEFLQRHPQSAVGDEFRRELMLLLSNLQHQELFVEFYAQEIANESRECEYLRARVELGQTQGLAPLIAQRWLTPHRLNAACEPAFHWLREAGVLDAALTAERVELLLAQGNAQFARIIARQLPEEAARTYVEWSELLERPIAGIDRLIAEQRLPTHPEALRGIWSRASVQVPDQALARLSDVLDLLSPEDPQRAALTRELALGLAWDRRSESLEVFARMPSRTHDDYTLGWLTRAALWNRDFAAAEQALMRLSPEAAGGSAWLYWRARVLELDGQGPAAQTAYAQLEGRDNYYSALAAARSGARVVPDDQPERTTAAASDSLSQLDGMQRARELLLAGERVAATREWRYATQGFGTDELVAAIELADDWGWHDMAVSTATRAGVFFDYRRLYPRPFSGAVVAAASAHDIEANMLLAVIRQESMFRNDAVSSAQALGLMQLQLGTARQTARSLGMSAPTRADLFEPAQNTMLGAATLRVRLANFDGQLPVALAAYNAGAAAAARWLPEATIDSDIWIENIPYNETREYVHRVIWNSIVYDWLDDGAPVDTGFLLSTVRSGPAD